MAVPSDLKRVAESDLSMIEHLGAEKVDERVGKLELAKVVQ